MLLSSGNNGDTQWFDYRPSFFGPVVRVEWDADTKFAELPEQTAGWLIHNGYARVMTDEEVEEYTSPSEPPVEASSRPNKGA